MFSAALAPRVRVRVLEELAEGLDPNKRSAMIQLLVEDVARGTTILLSSHHLGEVDRVCDTFVFLSAGKKISVERAEDVERRAERLVKLDFADAAGLPAIAARLRSAKVSVRGATLLVELAGDDPRDFLAELSGLRDLAAPLSVEYGKTSLQDLYRTLYDVEEAC
jgi:ABC-2 type transport system ATP-binding protein